MPSSSLYHDPPPAYIEHDPLPEYTEHPAPSPVFSRLESEAEPTFRRLDSDIDANTLSRPVPAPPRTYIPTHAPSLNFTHTNIGPSITLTDLTRPHHQRTVDEDFGASSRSGRRPNQRARSDATCRGCTWAILAFVVILTITIIGIVYQVTKKDGDERVGKHGCGLIMDGVCEGVLDWANLDGMDSDG